MDKIFEELIKNTSGHKSRESNFKNLWPETYIDILNFTNKFNLINLSFSEKLWHYFNKVTNIPICKNKNCNNILKYKGKSKGYGTYCCKKCMVTCDVAKSKIKKNREKTNLKKFGFKTPSENLEIRNKIIATNQLKYNGNASTCCPNIRAKGVATNLKKYGVENPMQLEKFQEKRIKSFKENIEQWKQSYMKTSLEKYGTEHPWQSKEVRSRMHRTIKEKYGNNLNNHIQKIKTKNLIKKYKKEIPGFIKFENQLLAINCTECNKEYSITPHFYWRRIRYEHIACINCNPIDSNITSSGENQLIEFIKNNSKFQIIENDRKILNGKELDIYIPELNLAIEYNGLYWHSENFKGKNYHLDKSILCKNKNIQLIHIYEDDWNFKQNIVKSILLNKLKLSKRLYARKCEIRQVNSEESSQFLVQNHIQGNVNSSIRIGLYYNNELVSLMTFGKLRKSLGQINIDDKYEMLRFCNKLNTSVIGGASKLFKYFITNYNPTAIISYASIDRSNGNLYEQLGFKLDSISKPGYYYIVNGIREHRFNYRKDKLIEEGYDSIKTEHEIMNDRGIYRIYDSGNLKFIYEN